MKLWRWLLRRVYAFGRIFRPLPPVEGLRRELVAELNVLLDRIDRDRDQQVEALTRLAETLRHNRA